MVRLPPRSTLDRSSAASGVYKRQISARGNPVSRFLEASVNQGAAADEDPQEEREKAGEGQGDEDQQQHPGLQSAVRVDLPAGMPLGCDQGREYSDPPR